MNKKTQPSSSNIQTEDDLDNLPVSSDPEKTLLLPEDLVAQIIAEEEALPPKSPHLEPDR